MRAKDLLKYIPSEVRVTKEASYEVVWIDDFDDPNKVGECRPFPRQIVLKRGQSPTETFKTFIHEVIHAVSFENEIEITEDQTCLFEEGIYKLLKLNKII